jgi:quinol monooxygenase YgiN
MPMVIIAGHLEVDAAERDQYVAAHGDLVRRARQAPGCLDLAITADALDPTRVNNFERWQSVEHLDAWQSPMHRTPGSSVPVAADSTCSSSVFIDVPPPGCARTFPPRSAPAAEPVRRSAWQRARTPSAVGIPGGPPPRSRPRR